MDEAPKRLDLPEVIEDKNGIRRFGGDLAALQDQIDEAVSQLPEEKTWAVILHGDVAQATAAATIVVKKPVEHSPIGAFEFSVGSSVEYSIREKDWRGSWFVRLAG